MNAMDLESLEDAGLTAQALHELGPAMTQAIRNLTNIQHDLLAIPSIPQDLLEERTAMNKNLLQLLKQAAAAIQISLEDMKEGREVSVPCLTVLHPKLQTSYQAQGLAAFIDQCVKLVAAIDSYADAHPRI